MILVLKFYIAVLNLLMHICGLINGVIVLLLFPVIYTDKLHQRFDTPFGWLEKRLLKEWCNTVVYYEKNKA